MLDKIQSAFDIFHNTTMNIVELGNYDDYENTYADNKMIGTVIGDLQSYSGGLAEKEYGLTVECQYAFYCHTNDKIKEGVYTKYIFSGMATVATFSQYKEKYCAR